MGLISVSISDISNCGVDDVLVSLMDAEIGVGSLFSTSSRSLSGMMPLSRSPLLSDRTEID